jgi:hypothetical protein
MDKPVFIRNVGSTSDKHILSEFRCHCGRVFVTMRCRVKEGIIYQCQECARATIKRKNTKHGGRGSPTYRSWQAMKRRCANTDDKDYHRYGAKGITIYGPWIHSYESFIAHVGERLPNTSLDRIDNLRGYEPGNVRWATIIEQAENRKKVVLINWRGTPTRVKYIAKELGITEGAVYMRNRRGKLYEPE